MNPVQGLLALLVGMGLAGVGAAIQTAALVWGFTVGEYAAYTPVWTRIALVVLIGPAIVAGTAVRARAARYS